MLSQIIIVEVLGACSELAPVNDLPVGFAVASDDQYRDDSSGETTHFRSICKVGGAIGRPEKTSWIAFEMERIIRAPTQN